MILYYIRPGFSWILKLEVISVLRGNNQTNCQIFCKFYKCEKIVKFLKEFKNLCKKILEKNYATFSEK